MTLNPDEKELLESFERGEWRSVVGDRAALRKLARERLRIDVQPGLDDLARTKGRSYDRASGRWLRRSAKTRGGPASAKKP